MAILDSLIIQLSLDNSSLTKGAKQAQRTLTELEDKAASSAQHLSNIGTKSAEAFSQFKREAMGAMALFTGGKSLSHLTQEVIQAHTAFSTLSLHLGSTPRNLTNLYTALQKLPSTSPAHTSPALPFQNQAPLSSRSLAPSEAPLQTTPPTRTTHTAPASTPPLSPNITQQLETWSQLLQNSSHIIRHALEDIEPTFHNAQKALTNTPTAPFPKTAGDTHNITQALANISALLTARSALTLHQEPPLPQTPATAPTPPIDAAPPHQQDASPSPAAETVQHTARETSPLQATSILPHSNAAAPTPSAPQPAQSHLPTPRIDTPSHPAPTAELDTAHLLQHYRRITQLVRSAPSTQGASHALIPTPAQTNNGASPHLPTLNEHLRQLSPSPPTTTHTTTTHNPTINITIHGTPHHQPEHIAHAAQQGISAALARHELNRIG